MRVLVCGERRYRHWFNVVAALDALAEREPIDLVMQSGNRLGADRAAAEWAWHHKVPVHTYYANPKGSGDKPDQTFLRNQQMIDEGRPDYVIAFGQDFVAYDLLQRARAAGIVVKRYPGS